MLRKVARKILNVVAFKVFTYISAFFLKYGYNEAIRDFRHDSSRDELWLQWKAICAICDVANCQSGYNAIAIAKRRRFAIFDVA